MSLRRPILTAIGLAVFAGGIIGAGIGWFTGRLTKPPARVLDFGTVARGTETRERRHPGR